MKYMKYTDISVKNNKKYKTVMCILAVIGVISGCGNTSQQTLAEIHSTESPQNVETLGQENLGDASAETEQESQTGAPIQKIFIKSPASATPQTSASMIYPTG